jgi:hypothetical protein
MAQGCLEGLAMIRSGLLAAWFAVDSRLRVDVSDRGMVGQRKAAQNFVQSNIVSPCGMSNLTL